MAKFLIKASYNAEGVRGLLKDGGSKRKKVVEKLIAASGGKLEAFYFAFGNHDVYAIAELPDLVSIAALTMNINSSGLVSNSTTVLLTPEEVDKAVKKSVKYRAPGK